MSFKTLLAALLALVPMSRAIGFARLPCAKSLMLLNVARRKV